MRSVLISRSYSRARVWAGITIDPKEFGPGGVLQDGLRVHFDYYDDTPFCHGYSITFKTEAEAKEFVRWYSREKPYCVYDHD